MKKFNKIIIKSFPRIHMTLLDMNGEMGRINGGIGFSINKPYHKIEFHKSDSININYDCYADKKIITHINLVINKILEQHSSFNADINIKKLIPYHIGFGSTTSLTLNLVEGIFLCNDVQASNEDIIRISGRGNTSGIGVNTYFRGNFIFDLGHHVDPGKDVKSFFLPSFKASFKGFAPVLYEKKLPHWKLIICVPKIPYTNETDELDFFKKVCPVPSQEISDLIRFVVMGVIPSIITENFAEFCSKVSQLQTSAWKRREIDRFGTRIWDLFEELKQHHIHGIGMSSMGPLIFGFLNKNNSPNIEDMKRKLDLRDIFITTPRSNGREISYQ